MRFAQFKITVCSGKAVRGGRCWVFAWLLSWTFGATAADPATSDAVSFRHDIVPILSQSGCNSGGCHGALAGKGGFRLSLFGYDAESDHFAITRELRGRRLEPSDPGRSLLLTKATAALKHQGGKRFDVDSEEYRILARWIAAGAPGPAADDTQLTGVEVAPSESVRRVGDDLALTVTASFSDGTRRDVTRWARFSATDETVATVGRDGRVRILGAGVGAVTAWYSSRVALARITSPYTNTVEDAVFAKASGPGFIDQLVLAQLKELRLPPSPPADDATFVRRAFLDVIGRLPTAEEVRAFVQDRSPGKHERLADFLLARPEFVDFWAYRWSDLLLVTGSKLRPDAISAYYQWIRDAVAENKPWDAWVRELITARGSSVDEGASNFYAVHQDPEAMAENVSQAFLALSINCAKCHNHPLEKWTNDQYYSFANLFARVRAKGWGGDPRNGDGKRTLYVEDAGDLIQPRTGKPQPPAPLDAPPLEGSDPADRRVALAAWLTSPDNPYFTRAIVNRVWASFLGSGLVEPVDDLRASNPASNEKLLEALARHLIAERYDLKRLMRTILISQTYRRSSEPVPGNESDLRHHARYQPRRLMAEVLSDAIADVTGVSDTFSEIALNDGSSEKTTAYTNVTRSLQLRDAAVRSYFLKTFGRHPREITCECERSNQPSLVQVLHLSNGNTLNEKLASKTGHLTRWLATEPTPIQILEEAWMRCLGRAPTAAEVKATEPLLTEASAPAARREVVEDLYWSLLTSREFLFQH